ncbi:hypothetical protein Dimus_039024 [Dionaea muscipula]
MSKIPLIGYTIYTTTLNNLHLGDNDPFDNPTVYRSTIGALQYLTLTRPDLAFAVNKLSQFLQAPTMFHWNACKRVLRYVKGTLQLGLVFRPATRLVLEGFSDADWACNPDDRKSTSDLFITLGGNLITWSSQKKNFIALSSMESEYRVLASTSTEIVWIQSVFAESGISLDQSTASIWCDNQGARLLAFNPVFHSRTKHIEVDVHYIRELVSKKRVDVCYIPNEEQPVDFLTKALPAPRFDMLRSKLAMDFLPRNLRGDVS